MECSIRSVGNLKPRGFVAGKCEKVAVDTKCPISPLHAKYCCKMTSLLPWLVQTPQCAELRVNLSTFQTVCLARLQLGRHAGPQLHQSRTMSLAQHVTQSEGFDYVEQAGDGPPSHGDDERADETTALLSTHRPPNRKWRYMKFGLGHQAEPERQVAAY